MTAATQPWPGFKYEPVRGLADRRIARYLRTQRKNMRRFFAERGLYDELEQMERIRKSRQGMMAKNQMFREVLDDYAKRTASVPGPETPHLEDARAQGVVVPSDGNANTDGPAAVPVRGVGVDAGGGVQEVAGSDSDGPVIEE